MVQLHRASDRLRVELRRLQDSNLLPPAERANSCEQCYKFNTTLTGLSSVTSTNFVGALTGNANTSTKISSITNSNKVQLTETRTLTNKTLDNPNIITNCNTESTNGHASLDIGGALGGYIDLKAPLSDDYDLRVIHDNGTSKSVSKTSLI